MSENIKVDDRKVAGWISDTVGALHDPIICHGQNLDRPPEDIQQTITLQRLIENIVAIREHREPMGTDAEAAWYLSSASLEFPFDEQWTRIYMYAFNKLCESMKKEVPPDLRQDKLDNYDTGFYLDLKRWLYRVRAEHRKKQDIAARREKREQAKQEETALRPTLFGPG